MSAEPTQDPTATLVRLLDLNSAAGARTDEEIYVATPVRQPGKRVFGGQVLAQALVAATRTVDPVRSVHSMHGYFLRAGDADLPITFGVERLRDGRSFSARRVHAYQSGVPILSMIASFQQPDDGVTHQEAMPAGIPDPDSLPSTADLLGRFDNPVARAWAYDRPFDIRHIESPLYVENTGTRAAVNAVWMKTFGPMPEDRTVHEAALAYASDYTLLESILRPHGLTWIHPGMSVASLDHAMWWHRPVRVDDWLLYMQQSPSASGARGLATGKIYNRAGDLVATVAQEGMVRVPGGGVHLRGATQETLMDQKVRRFRS